MSPRLFITMLALMSGAPFAGSPPDSLYTRLGGATRVAAFVDQMIANATADPRIPHTLADADLAQLRCAWVGRVCALSGGGCRVDDRTVPGLSAGTIEELRRAMRAQDVPLAARNELLELLAAAPRDHAGP